MAEWARRYRGYRIAKSGFNYTVNKPGGERLGAELAATYQTAKRFVDWDIHEAIVARRRRQEG